MDFITKELQIHTLRGDIQQIGMKSNCNKHSIRKILESQYVRDTESPITQAEFNRSLDEEYTKIAAWRSKK